MGRLSPVHRVRFFQLGSLLEGMLQSSVLPGPLPLGAYLFPLLFFFQDGFLGDRKNVAECPVKVTPRRFFFFLRIHRWEIP